jgi:CDP-diglyceride synthetase
VDNILVAAHALLANTLVLMAIALGLWGTASYIRAKAVSGSFRAAYLLMFGVVVIQSLFGLALLIAGHRPHLILHIVYGIFAAVFLPGLYFYSARGNRSREAAFLAASCWIVLIAYLRGITTGAG